jgi:hypothetical protein
MFCGRSNSQLAVAPDVITFYSVRPQKSWPVCLPTLGMLFRVIGEATYPLLTPLISSLVGTFCRFTWGAPVGSASR